MFKQKIAAALFLPAILAPNLTASAQTNSSSAAATTPTATAAAAARSAVYRAPDEVINRIKEEGDKRSQVLQTLRYLTDNIGPRLTNSPAQRRANLWTRDKLIEWGMQNARLESWGTFGRGWELRRFSASVIEPMAMPLHAYPKGWSPGTNGAITGEVVYVDATDEAGLEKYRGKLRGAIVLTGATRDIKPGFDPAASRRSEKDLLTLADAHDQQAFPNFQPNPQQIAAAQFNARKFQFYLDEGAAVLIDPSQGVDGGAIRVVGATVPNPAGTNPFTGGRRAWDKDAPKTIPQLVASIEQYNRLVRLAQQNVKMRMTVDLDVQFFEDDLNGNNTLADLPGTDLKDEVVMIGAHLDSWHSATGSTDNASGVAVMMEAMRILKTLNLQPRRTIRVALWTGEEQGLFGSRRFVEQNLATLGDGSPSAGTAAMFGADRQQLPINKKPAYDKFSAYYNLDNGTGSIRGVYMQENEALRPIFRTWLQPFREMGATTLTIQNTGGTDHVPFDAVGLPGFQFIQDPIEYFTRTWHTTQDVSDRVIEKDLKQSAVIIAAFAYQTAMMDEKLPRKQR